MRHWQRVGALAGALCLLTTLTSVSASGDPAGTPEERALAQQLLIVLTSARLVIQRNQPLINDRGETDKGLTGELVLQQTLKLLKRQYGERMEELDPYSRAGQLLDSQLQGRPAFRFLVPEYHTEACLLCHGETRGEIDPSGYPKEGAGPGELAGAISIVIFR